MTLNQLHYNQKPLGYLYVNGYYDKLIDFCKSWNGGRAPVSTRAKKNYLIVSGESGRLLDRMGAYGQKEVADW